MSVRFDRVDVFDRVVFKYDLNHSKYVVVEGVNLDRIKT